MQINYPFRLDGRGRTAAATEEEHIRQLIEQVLFTMPGERVHRPDFGSDIRQLLFASNSDELATATDFLVRGALQQWLGDLIQVEDVRIEYQEATLYISVQYIIQRSQQRQVSRFQQGETM
jgi:phage baseplate assembly protein W